MHGKVVDTATGLIYACTPGVSVRRGRYIPPYGHRHEEINYGWFRIMERTSKLLDSSFAYIDGTFQVELPVGEVYVEMTKGFEYEGRPQETQYRSTQRELNLEISRFADNRSKGWVTADTHVHFLSPSTAVLQGQAEGLNLINLLAAQWGDLFTNVGDITQGDPLSFGMARLLSKWERKTPAHPRPHVSARYSRRTDVPMSAARTPGKIMGDPLWNSLADWSNTCREQRRVLSSPPFPLSCGRGGSRHRPGQDGCRGIPLRDRGEGLYQPSCLVLVSCIELWLQTARCWRNGQDGGFDACGMQPHLRLPRSGGIHLRQLGQSCARRKHLHDFRPVALLPRRRSHAGRRGHPVREAPVEVRRKLRASFRCTVLRSCRTDGWSPRTRAEWSAKSPPREKVKVDGPGWLAARCISNGGQNTAREFKVLAHTSPVYLQMPGQELFAEPGATFLMTLIEGAQTWMDTLATRPDLERLDRIRKMLGEAKERLHQRMHQYGIQH